MIGFWVFWSIVVCIGGTGWGHVDSLIVGSLFALVDWAECANGYVSKNICWEDGVVDEQSMVM